MGAMTTQPTDQAGDFSPEVTAELVRRYERLGSTPAYPLDQVLKELGIDVPALASQSFPMCPSGWSFQLLWALTERRRI